MDARTEDFKDIMGFYLDHSCDNWVIGNLEQAKQFAKDLLEMIKKVETEELTQ